jgi:hypothetical protein
MRSSRQPLIVSREPCRRRGVPPGPTFGGSRGSFGVELSAPSEDAVEAAVAWLPDPRGQPACPRCEHLMLPVVHGFPGAEMFRAYEQG